MLWDLFCRVIDNFGDIGVSWRLAAELGRRGHQVRLWTDDASALAWMAPAGAPGVQVLQWADPPLDSAPGDVVVETFGCAPPDAFLARMAQVRRTPVWINLEYLSAEPYVERSHGLMSPQFSGPAAGLKKWFFYPGFTAATGGLMPAGTPIAVDQARAWAHEMGWQRDAQEQLVTVFCYQNPALPALLQTLRPQRCALLLAPGPARAQLQTLDLPPGLRQVDLPYLRQSDFDRLLACADLNLVRGEDSFVRAQCCATGPFLWQAYPQHDGAQGPKLEAFLDLYLAGQAPPLATSIRALFRAFNGQGLVPTSLPDRAAWRAVQAAWGRKLQAQTDLCSQLIGFVRQKQA